MDIFDHATGLTFHDSNFSQIQAQHNHEYKLFQIFNYTESRNAALEALRQHAKTSATYDSGERSEAAQCYPGTRLLLLKEIEGWIHNSTMRRDTRCIWVSGAAGGGKTAIAQTLAERCDDQGALVLSFFFSHLPAESGNLSTVIHTIAHQLCTPMSKVSPCILQAIRNDPMIFQKALRLQMDRLIIRPFCEACQADPHFKSTNTVVILDGLDACGSATEQQLLLTLFMDALTQNDIPLALFVTSRPEIHIATIFDKYPNCFRQIVLDSRFAPSADIAHFVRSSLNELAKSLQSITGSSWPPEEAIATIVERSSGEFLYASDAIKYVCSPRRGAEGRLQEVLTHRKGHSMLPKVDFVFKQLLESIEPHHLDTVLNTLAWMAIYGGHFTVIDRANLPKNTEYPIFSFPWLARMLDQPPSKGFESFNTLRSLIDIPEHPESRLPLRIYHASLFDFLADETRAGSIFFMDKAAAHGRIVECMARRFRLQRGGSTPVSRSEAQDELRWAEKVIRCHLVQARSTEELVRSIEALAGLGRQGSGRPQNSPSSLPTGVDTFSIHDFTCDTKRTIVFFLKNFYQSRNRRESVRKRLTMFWFFKTFPTKRCGKLYCSCAAGRISCLPSPP